jgi:hypothetical protein
MTRVAWGVLLQGTSEEMADWTEVLKPGFDPWIETHGADTVLRSCVLDGLETASEVHDKAGALIDVLKGAVALSQGAGPLKYSGVAELSSDGKLHKHVFFSSMHIDLDRFRTHAVGVALGPDGKPLPPLPAQPSEVQNWSATAQSDGFIWDALIYYGRATDWFDIYKALECLILKFGRGGSDRKREKTFKELGWAPKNEICRLKRTANWLRHAQLKYKRPPSPMPIQEARSLLGALLRRALTEGTT